MVPEVLNVHERDNKASRSLASAAIFIHIAYENTSFAYIEFVESGNRHWMKEGECMRIRSSTTYDLW